MTCPDWLALAAERERDPGTDPAGWAAACAHLELCPACRRAAVAADPLLLFQRLEAPRADAAEVVRMQQAVAALVGAARVARRGRRGGGLGRVAAAAAVALLALAVQSGPRPAPPRAGSDLAALAFADGEPAFSPGPAPPVLEELDRPEARVYQLPAEGLSVVLIVDSSLDV